MSDQPTPVHDETEVSSGHSAELEIIADRRAKVAALRASGIEPYPPSAAPTADIASMRAAHEELEAGEETDVAYTLAGRLMGKRGHGKAMFADLQDRTGRVQLHVTLDRIGEEEFSRFADLDLGDWIAVDGTAMRSRRGELSLAVTSCTLLAKCLRPMPDKHHGLTDIETRLSRRYLDLAVNRESLDRFVLRSKAVSAIRRFLEDRGYLEVETPVLQPIYGGAAARPFTTHHNELDQQLYLRIAVELYLKRLIVGGMERVFEIGKNFRNEGISYKHNPEFTMIELYEAYADYAAIMELFEEMIRTVAEQALGSTTITYGEHEIDLAPAWRRITLRDGILEGCGVDIESASEDEMRAKLEQDGYDTSADKTWAQLVDHLLSRYLEPQLIQPTFVTDYPVELSPFARMHRDGSGRVERFEAFVAGMEIANAFSELNDPEDQRTRFEALERAREAGDEDAEETDEDYIRALEYGMPPTGGLGMGIDRFLMVLSGTPSVRDVILFPARRT